MTQLHSQNLLTLAGALCTVPHARFNMLRFIGTNAAAAVRERPTPQNAKRLFGQGASACALGYGAVLLKSRVDLWSQCADELFGISYADAEWPWLFCDEWSGVDNTPTGAAKRILSLLYNGLPAQFRATYETTGDCIINPETVQYYDYLPVNPIGVDFDDSAIKMARSNLSRDQIPMKKKEEKIIPWFKTAEDAISKSATLKGKFFVRETNSIYSIRVNPQTDAKAAHIIRTLQPTACA